MTEDTPHDRFMELCALAKFGSIKIISIEVKFPTPKRKINGLYRVVWREKKYVDTPSLF